MSDTSLNLFGGAISAIAPSNLIDASTLRQVPDTQEVLLFPDSSISIIVEILQRVESNDNHDAVKFHFDSLAHNNDAVFSEVVSVNTVPNDRGDATPSAITLSGVQRVPKFNKTTPDEVRVLMALYRVIDKGIDLVVTFNIPVVTQDDGAVQGEQLEQAQQQFNRFARSLRIEDFSLFA
ncbi:Mog1p/PsbP-like protein [Gymnopus androsaceus JB14]|uniref:Mog1p/PsbP-like protein n=1 Tax=Gymnopus androsaceus JB14 TaxID=1447944 RepID=A0A6A4IBF6_9AGAR|nr:Mog1p/PsbP-like protein [Gymnopus androsaceus JB14]